MSDQTKSTLKVYTSPVLVEIGTLSEVSGKVIEQLRQEKSYLAQLLNDCQDDNDAALLAEIERLQNVLRKYADPDNWLGNGMIWRTDGNGYDSAREALEPANSLVKDTTNHTAQLREALVNLLDHVQMIGVTDGFPIEVYPDPEYPAFDIKAALIQAYAALGRETDELQAMFPEMFSQEMTAGKIA